MRVRNDEQAGTKSGEVQIYIKDRLKNLGNPPTDGPVSPTLGEKGSGLEPAIPMPTGNTN